MNSQYYNSMLKFDRLIPLEIEGKVQGLITYVLCNDVQQLNNKNPFEPIFSPEGRVCYIEQLIYKSNASIQESLSIFKCLQSIIQKKHPEVRVVFWKRYNRHTKKLNLHIYNLQREVPSYVYN